MSWMYNQTRVKVSHNVWATLAKIKEANKLGKRSCFVVNTPENREVLVRLQEKGNLLLFFLDC